MKEEEKMKECSFKPRINKQGPNQFKYDKSNLYKYKVPQPDINTHDVEYEKVKNECTFAPELINKNYYRDDNKLITPTAAAARSKPVPQTTKAKPAQKKSVVKKAKSPE